MEESVFNAFLKNAKNEYEEKIEKQKAEDERIKKEKEDNERIRLENEKLKKEVEENKKREFRESTPIIKDVKLEDNTERDKKEKEYITYRDSLNFDKFEKEE
ncbi:MAG: hypothetical protein PF569_03960 [Candidatus Woesearchaeota archaeon]|jgi:hypothetical protein|nr:hypothetical protein [Candidatus Woesearchaeota archaeon]